MMTTSAAATQGARMPKINPMPPKKSPMAKGWPSGVLVLLLVFTSAGLSKAPNSCRAPCATELAPTILRSGSHTPHCLAIGGWGCVWHTGGHTEEYID